MELNPEQLAVVNEADGTALVIAGPGSGKTRTLVHRVARLLDSGTDPRSILLLTFTNKAAREMKARVESLSGEKAKLVTAGTFHHFANLLLRQHHSKFGLKASFSILDEEDAVSLIKRLLQGRFPQVKKGAADDIRKAISLSKLRLRPLDELLEGPEFYKMHHHIEDVVSVARDYESAKRRANCVDFDDLLIYAREILCDNALGEIYRGRFTNVLVDEFQDTDRLQASIIELLHEKGHSLMVVGDDCQSIYSFRGADIKNMLEFREKFNAKTFVLARNYRSTSAIVSFINRCISNSRQKLDKELLAEVKGGEPPLLIPLEDRILEAKAAADAIEAELAKGRSVGTLFRSAYLSSELELELTRRGIPYEMRGGPRFFEQRHIKDMMSLIRSFLNPGDSGSVIRLLSLFPRIGEKSAMKAAENLETPEQLARSLAQADKSGACAELIREIFASGGNAAAMLDRFYLGFYQKYLEENFEDAKERKADVETLVGAAAGYPDVVSFADALSLDSLDSPQKKSPLVLSTIHQAKGLEWDSVLVIGLADGMLPSSRAEDIEEERRLFYVAASRARHALILTYPRSSGRFYDFAELGPSRFIMELPEDSFRVAQ
ncbi:MAG TPA: ATP-dependent helicase [Candidatus Bilamarchaeum sp.]|nr:ATP-dependent helicase [Candidatus Bilamarchaeum sp.]